MSSSVHKGRVRTAWLLALCYAACLIVNLVWPLGCLAADGSRGGWRTVRIASEGARPPYNYLENNKLAGFRNRPCTRFMCPHEGVLRLHRAGLGRTYSRPSRASLRCDHGGDGNHRRSPRKNRVHQTIHPHAFRFHDPKAASHSGYDSAGLAGKAIGVELGGTHEAYLEDVYKQSEIRPYATLEEAILDLAEGRLDAVIGDKDAIAEYMKTRKEARCCVLDADVPRDPAYFGDGIGIGLRKEDEALKAMFEEALDYCVADGTFAKIAAKYFAFRID